MQSPVCMRNCRLRPFLYRYATRSWCSPGNSVSPAGRIFALPSSAWTGAAQRRLPGPLTDELGRIVEEIAEYVA